jgi:hypothetical protein
MEQVSCLKCLEFLGGCYILGNLWTPACVNNQDINRERVGFLTLCSTFCTEHIKYISTQHVIVSNFTVNLFLRIAFLFSARNKTFWPLHTHTRARACACTHVRAHIHTPLEKMSEFPQEVMLMTCIFGVSSWIVPGNRPWSLPSTSATICIDWLLCSVNK